MNAQISCFLVYSWADGKAHQRWVVRLANALIDLGIMVRFDEFERDLGDDITEWIERSIRDSTYVLIICTPVLAKNVKAEKGFLAYEFKIIRGELALHISQDSKYIPLLRKGTVQESLPDRFRVNGIIDFCEDSRFDKSMASLIKAFYNRDSLSKISKTDTGIKFQNLKQFASVALDLKGTSAISWARDNFDTLPNRPADELTTNFIRAAEFISSPDVLNCSYHHATEWVIENLPFVVLNPDGFISKFTRLVEFAYDMDSGPRMKLGEAREWAVDAALDIHIMDINNIGYLYQEKVVELSQTMYDESKIQQLALDSLRNL